MESIAFAFVAFVIIMLVSYLFDVVRKHFTSDETRHKKSKYSVEIENTIRSAEESSLNLSTRQLTTGHSVTVNKTKRASIDNYIREEVDRRMIEIKSPLHQFKEDQQFVEFKHSISDFNKSVENLKKAIEQIPNNASLTFAEWEELRNLSESFYAEFKKQVDDLRDNHLSFPVETEERLYNSFDNWLESIKPDEPKLKNNLVIDEPETIEIEFDEDGYPVKRKNEE